MRLRVFMCEFVTGGGMRREPLPPSLSREGMMMRDALARDLSDLPEVTLVTTHDDRLPPPQGVASIAVDARRDPWALWDFCASSANVAWVIAPETDGLLERLTETCASAGALVVGPDVEAIRVASSKRLTAERLIERGVPALPAWRPDEVPSGATGPFVSKPDDGAGCADTLFWPDRPEASALEPDHVLQPFLAGRAASVTALRTGDGACVLSANEQHVTIAEGRFAFRGLTVGALADTSGELAAIADGVARAIPGLGGIFGIDVVVGGGGPVVVEVNPRLTTSYVGLRDALGVNPATLVAPFSRRVQDHPPTAARAVEITV